MSRLSSHAIYIIHAHNGFVTSSCPTHKELQAEILRLNLALPVRVFFWTKMPVADPVHGPVRGWRLVEEFNWT